MNVDLNQLKPVSATLGDSPKDSELLLSMANDATRFIEDFAWCGGVVEQYFGIGVGGVLALFLCRIQPTATDVDEWLWVIVGDLPPAYIVTDDAPTAKAALKAYVGEMSKWAEAAKNGSDVTTLIPVNVPATPDWGYELERRLGFIQERITNR